MDDLAGFLNARLDDDASYANWVHAECATEGPIPLPCNCSYPARVRREVEAKRAILAAYAANDADVQAHLGPYPRKHGEWDGLGLAVRHLAAVYSGHPDYRQEWTA